jgi:hypothetical protein
MGVRELAASDWTGLCRGGGSEIAGEEPDRNRKRGLGAQSLEDASVRRPNRATSHVNPPMPQFSSE